MTESMLNTEIREESGKYVARRLRRNGRVPAVFYGDIEKPVPITVDSHELELKLKEGRSIFNLSIDGKAYQSIVREIQYHPVKGTVLHIDFLAVKKGHKVTMTIPIRYEGKPEGVKAGGSFQELKNELQILVLPKNIPDEVVVNIDNLKLGESLRVADIHIENAEMQEDPQDIICRVAIPKAVEELEAEEEVEEGEGEEPEVITARDKEEAESDQE